MEVAFSPLEAARRFSPRRRLCRPPLPRRGGGPFEVRTPGGGEFGGSSLRASPPCPSAGGSERKRDVLTRVIPFLRGSAFQQPPPDLASYLYRNRIVYLGMPIFPSVTELLVAEFLYLQYEDADRPVYLYINSTGSGKGGEDLGNEKEALAIYDAIRYLDLTVFTLCVGNAWGEAAILLAAGAKGNRAALPSASIMIKQPIGQYLGLASDVDIASKEMAKVKGQLINLLAMYTEKTPEQIYEDTRRPKYFTPTEAIEYGIIDKVLYNEKGALDHGVVSAFNSGPPK